MIRVLLAEDAEMIREALVSLLQREPDIEVVATAAGRHRWPCGGRCTHRPDVAVVDLEMPGLDGLEVVAELARALPSLPGGHPDRARPARRCCAGRWPRGRRGSWPRVRRAPRWPT